MPQIQVVHLDSDQKLIELMRGVAGEFQLDPAVQQNLSDGLRDFLTVIELNDTIKGVVLMMRRETYRSPILDVYLFWSTPIDFAEDNAQFRELLGQHADILENIDPGSFESFLHSQDLRHYGSVEELAVGILASDGKYGPVRRVLACVSFNR